MAGWLSLHSQRHLIFLDLTSQDMNADDPSKYRESRLLVLRRMIVCRVDEEITAHKRACVCMGVCVCTCVGVNSTVSDRSGDGLSIHLLITGNYYIWVGGAGVYAGETVLCVLPVCVRTVMNETYVANMVAATHSLSVNPLLLSQCTLYLILCYSLLLSHGSTIFCGGRGNACSGVCVMFLIM